MIVVTGATGNVGRELVILLAAAGAQVTATSRRRPDALPDGVRHQQLDLSTDPGGLAPTLAGAQALFVLTPGHDLDVARLLDTATAGGVKKIVLLSSQRIATRPLPGLSAFEDAVTAAGLDWTFLRPGGFASNTLLWAQQIRAQRTVSAPFGDVGLPVIDPADIAAVAAAALLEPGHVGRSYLLTGPEVITPRQQAAEIGGALGEPVEFVEQTRDEARAALAQHWPLQVVDDTLDILGRPLPIELQISPDVEQVLGRAPYPFAAWAQRNVAAFV